MNYIYAEEGNEKSDIKVISDKGDVKYFPKHIAEDDRLMKDAGFKICEAPLKMEPKKKEEKPEQEKVKK